MRHCSSDEFDKLVSKLGNQYISNVLTSPIALPLSFKGAELEDIAYFESQIPGLFDAICLYVGNYLVSH